MLAVTYAAVLAGFIPMLFAAASYENCTAVFPAVTLEGEAGVCADTVDVLGEIQQNVSAMLGEVVNCMKRADMQDVCYNSSAYSPTVQPSSVPFQEFYGCTGTHITGFTITASTSTYWLTSVQFTYVVNGAVVTGQRHGTYTHGTSYGTAYTVTLNPEERIIQIEGRAHSGAYLFQLTFTTNEGRTLGPYGTENGNRFTIDNCEPRGVFGYTFANVVDQIGFYCAETM